MIFRDLEQKIVQDLNESGMSIDAIYFIMKSIMAEIEQRYFDFCRQEDMERAKSVQKELEPNENNENIDTISNDEEGTN